MSTKLQDITTAATKRGRFASYATTPLYIKAYVKALQFQTVVRIDDPCQFMINKLVHHDQFPFVLKAWMR